MPHQSLATGEKDWSEHFKWQALHEHIASLWTHNHFTTVKPEFTHARQGELQKAEAVTFQSHLERTG